MRTAKLVVWLQKQAVPVESDWVTRQPSVDQLEAWLLALQKRAEELGHYLRDITTTASPLNTLLWTQTTEKNEKDKDKDTKIDR